MKIPQSMPNLHGAIAETVTWLEENGNTLEVTDAARKQLAEEGYDPVYGARPLKRVIQQRLQNELANAILGGEFEEGSRITIDVQNGDFTFGSAIPPRNEPIYPLAYGDSANNPRVVAVVTAAKRPPRFRKFAEKVVGRVKTRGPNSSPL